MGSSPVAMYGELLRIQKRSYSILFWICRVVAAVIFTCTRRFTTLSPLINLASSGKIKLEILYITMAKYILTRQADQDIEGVFLYTARRWDVEQAEKYLSELAHYMQKLADEEVTGKPCEVLAINGRGLKYYHANRHYIIYRKSEQVTEIIALYHDQMDLEYHLARLAVRVCH